VNPHPFNRDALIRAFFFGAFALILYQLFLLAQPFVTALLGAAMLAMIFSTLHRRIGLRLRNPSLAAFLSTAVVLLLAVLPLLGLGSYFIRETAELAPAAQRLLEDLRSHDWPAVDARLPGAMSHAVHALSGVLTRMNVDLKQVVMENAQIVGAQATAWATYILRNVIVTLMNSAILCVALFFAFRDGERLLQWALSLIPMQASHKQIVSQRVYETFRAVVVGSFLTSAVQGMAAMIGFLIAGVQFPVVLGMATSMASMLGASFLVTLPVALTVMRESAGRGIFLIVWGMGVVGVLDNILKPILIGSRARMPFILIFFSIVGGIKLYGFLGFILGPMLVASFLSFVKIYQEEYEAS
jgi:predicted PurR-regulated permease PerM